MYVATLFRHSMPHIATDLEASRSCSRSSTRADSSAGDRTHASARTAAGDRDVCTTAPRWMAKSFRPISLEKLNAKADMLQRRDNKYVVDFSVLEQAMPELTKHFDVLEIDGKRDFTYDTCYFDDAAHSGYFDHHKGRRIRCKVRMRKYVDAGLCFVEVKLKHKRGMTIKQRLQRPVAMHGSMDVESREFVERCYREHYGREFGRALEPTLEMRYQRVTLVAKDGGERMTMDLGLTFKGASGTRVVDGALCLVETKSRNANGIADKVLRALHQHPTNSCSKYCVALAALDQVRKYNKFLVALRRLDMVPRSSKPLPSPVGPRQQALAGPLPATPAAWTCMAAS